MWELLTGEEPYEKMRPEEIIGNIQFDCFGLNTSVTPVLSSLLILLLS